MKLVECVPNFSEGRDKNILNQIAEAIKSVKGINLLDIDPGEATNRTVFTFVGTPDNIVDGAFEGIKKAAELIDMSKHKGEHPRMGATDVCPFVPVSDVTMEECAELARKLGKRVGDELGIPIYLYEEAASKPERKNLADVRQSEYEGLKERFEGKDKDYWKPDFGPAKFNTKSGATAISAREFLIAYNINFNTKDKKPVHDIALNIREAGRSKRDENGKMVKDENGNTVKVPGTFKYVKAIGWVIPEYKRAQISINMTNYKVTPLHVVMEEVRKQADERGLIVTGSEVVGLIPKAAIIETGKFYLEKMGKPTSAPENEIVDCAILSLGLNDVSEFDPKKRIIEYAIDNRTDRLVDLKVKDFANELSSDSKAPGGGSVAALNGALAAALGAMVPNLTIGKKGYEQHFKRLNEIGEKCQSLKDFFIQAIDDDADAFNKVIEAMKAPREIKEKAIEDATKGATLVPFNVLEKTNELLPLLGEIIEKGNINSLSDVGVAILNASSAASAAYMNVIINLTGIADGEFVDRHKSEAEKIYNSIKEKSDKLTKQVINKLKT